MDIFFFIYSLFFGLPLGVVEVPRGVEADAAPSSSDELSHNTTPLCT